MWSNGPSEAALEAQLPLPIDIRPMRRARRFRLRLDDQGRLLRMTCPWRTSRRKALVWAIEQRAWIDRQIARVPPPLPFADGTVIPLDGVDVTICWSASAARTPRLVGSELHCGGDAPGVGRRVERYLRGQALATMSAEVTEFAARAGVVASSVAVGDARTRWGSCSSTGAIRLSWRLILAPPAVRRYVVAHEVAHLRHLDHGRDFAALESELVGPGIRAARDELRRIGPGLRRFGVG